jgi:predicted Ser/Thr protein kinase
MELERLGRYVIERVLGRGAMGVVYLARDPVIGRQVALKTLTLPSDPTEAEEFHQRFLREARAAGILSHPGIVTVHDAGVDESSGLSYIAMEYIEGLSIKQLQASGHHFAFGEVARIGSTIAAALDYAHARGVVHRDIKPANVLITSQGAVKITDFGVARLESSNLTTTGQFIGTPNYMSPEQITGGILDGRSDLFSLGVVLFELLTGARPFSGSSLTEVSYKIVHGPRPIPSQIRPGVPGAFNPIVLKLLEREPERRYARGADVARALDALRRILAGIPVEPPPRPAATAQVPRPATAQSLRAEIEASPTATSATILRHPVGRSLWRRRITPRWAAILVATIMVPVALVIGLLALGIDRDPAHGPPTGEPARRHRVAEAQRRAAEALAEGKPEIAERLLTQVWDQAPYGAKARDLLREVRRMQASIAEHRANEERATALIAEGKALLDGGDLQQARERFVQVQELVPGTQLADLAGQYVDLSEAKVRALPPSAGTAQPTAPASTPTPRPIDSTPASIGVYFNSPMSAGTIEVDVDGASLGKLPFNFSKKVFLGLRKKGTGVVEGDYQLPPGEHKLTVRLLDDDAHLLGEETFSVGFRAKVRYTLRIDMEGPKTPPRFSLRER